MSKGSKNILVYPRRYFAEDLLELKQNGEKWLSLVLNTVSVENHWLVCRENQLNGQKSRKQKDSNRFALRSMLLGNNLHPSSMIVQTDFLSDGHFYLDIDNQTKPNSISGYLKYESEVLDIDELNLVGPEMLRIPTINSRFAFPANNKYEDFLESDYAKERWRMSGKAMGERVWKRLCLLKIMIVGCGRSGEKAFESLARIGVGNIVVCDGDDLELRNLGEMELVTDKDLGRSKAEVLVEKISEIRRSTEKTDCFKFRAIKSYNFDSYEAQKAAQECDIIICCVDSDGGRAYASYIAARYHKVLLDIGTGILQVGNERKEGYDVRLILPTDGCLECCGGIDEQRAEIEMFNSYERNRQRTEGHLQREGSLRNV